MASKRMKNRVYWATVKARTYHEGSITDSSLRVAYANAFRHNLPDTMILDAYREYLEQIEEQHGPAGLRNVHNEDLWPVRERLAMSNQ